MKLHRNSQKRIYFDDAIYFITSKTFNNYQYFKERIFCDLFVENLRLCKRLKGFLLYGWVLNYDHFHLLVQPNDKWNISKVMQFLKRHVSRDINYIAGYNKYDQPADIPASDDIPTFEGDIRECRLQDDMDNCYQQIIDEHNKKIQILKFQFQQKCPNGHICPKFQWQKSYYDHYIRNDIEFNNFLDYIDYNPTKHGLPDDWQYIYSDSKYDDLADEC